MIFSFGDIELDEERLELRRAGQRLAVEPKVLDLLLLLARTPGRLVSKTELLHQLWGEVAVSDWALPRLVKEARRALGDSGQAQGVIETVRGRGYRLVAPVRQRRAAGPGREGRPSHTVAAALDRDPYVGRVPLLRDLETTIREADAGTGRLVLLSGDAGMGKTRTVRELAARRPDLAAVTGWCEDGIGAPALWPWSQILRRLAAGEGPVDVAALPVPWRTAIAPTKAANPAARATPDDRWLFEPASRLQGFDAVAEALLAASRARTLVLVLEDLQWADAPSLALLEFLAPRVGEGRLVLVCTYRAGDLHPGRTFALTLGRLASQPHARSFGVAALEAGDVFALAQAATGRPPDPETVAALLARSSGNPFLVRELAAQLAAGGATDRLPLGVRALGARRLERLAPETRRRLTLAAVCGERFELRWVEALAGDPPASRRAWLQEALDADLLAAEPCRPGRFAFRHALLREAIDELLDFDERARLHRRLGELLEAELPDPSATQLALLAHHFAAALPAEKSAERAIDYALRAAAAAAQRLAWEDAEHHAAAALRWLEERPPSAERDRARLDALLLLLAGWSATQRAGREVDDALALAAALAEAAGDPSRRARALALAVSFASLRGRYREARSAILGVSGDEDPALVRAARACEVTIDVFEGRFQSARALARRVERERMERGALPPPAAGIDPELVALAVTPIAAWVRGEDETARARLQHALASSGRDPSAQAFALFMGCVLHDLRLDGEALLELAGRIDPLCTRHHVAAFTGAGNMLTGLALDALGRGGAYPYAFAFDVLRGMTRSDSPPRLRTFVLSVAARFAHRAGRPADALTTLDDGLAYAEQTGERFLLAELLRLAAQYRAASGDAAGAREALERALAVARGQGAIGFEVRILSALCAQDPSGRVRWREDLQACALALGPGLRGPDRSEVDRLLGEPH